MAATRILFVEDEGIVRLMTAEYLREEGFEVIEAKSGDEAMVLLEGSENFDALITDVRMPGRLDGIDVATAARHRQPTLPVLIVSGGAPQLSDRLRALRPGAVFINKPYSLKEVAKVLHRLTGVC